MSSSCQAWLVTTITVTLRRLWCLLSTVNVERLSRILGPESCKTLEMVASKAGKVRASSQVVEFLFGVVVKVQNQQKIAAESNQRENQICDRESEWTRVTGVRRMRGVRV